MPPHQDDSLLAWLSTIREVSDGGVRRMEREIAIDRPRDDRPIARRMGELCRAGHVEHESGRWRIATTTLIWRHDCGELYGARDAGLTEAFAMAGLTLTIIESEFGASIWRFTGGRMSAQAACERLKLRFADDPGDRWLAALPAARDALREVAPLQRRSPLVSRFWQRFNESGRWGSEQPREDLESGLWRSRSPSPRIYLWLDDGGALRRLDNPEHRLLARWITISTRVRLRLGTMGLCVPQHPRLPMLLDRALRIASGGEVQGHGGDHWYLGIEAGRAAHVARVLGISLSC